MPRPPKSLQEKLDGYRRPRVMPGSKVYDARTDTYKARFSRVYKPAGLDFIKAYDVIYSAYWLKHSLIGYAEVNLFNALNYFAEHDTMFTQDGMAHVLGCAKKTLIVMLDRLENAELIHRLTLADVQGQPTYIVMRTPLFEAEALTRAKVKKRILQAGEELPKLTLESELERLRKALTSNLAKERRDDPAKHPEVGQRKRFWKATMDVFERDAQSALEFDRIVADLTADQSGKPFNLEDFKKQLAHECRKKGMRLTTQLRQLALEHRAFYASFNTRVPNADRAEAGGHARPNADRAEFIELARELLNGGGYTMEGLTKQWAGFWGAEAWAQIESELTSPA